jgi:putative hemolysin
MAVWNEIQQLRKNRSTSVHGVTSFAKQIGKHKAKTLLVISNRRNHQSS